MNANGHRRGSYFAIVAVALMIAVSFAAIFASSESEAAGTVTLSPGSGATVTVDGVSVSNYSEYVDGSFKFPGASFEDSDGKQYVFSKTGYTLVGWKANGWFSTTYAPGDTVSGSTTTYTAQWQANTITFDPNTDHGGSFSRTGGWGGSSSTDYYTIDYESTNKTVPGREFSRQSGSGWSSTTYNYTYSNSNPNYHFVGWSTNPDATYAEYTEGNTPDFSHSYKLYAIWKQSITITYNENCDIAPSPGRYSLNTYEDQVVYGNVFTVGNTTYSYTRPGYTFLGWSTDPSATVPEYVSGDHLATRETDITLYAVWVYGTVVVFDPNDGIASPKYTPAVDGSLYIPGDSFTVDGVQYTYSYTGYSFLGWSTDKHATSPEYVKGNMMSPPDPDSGCVLYAVWTPNTSKVTFDYGDGTIVEVEIDYGYTFDSASYMNYLSTDMKSYKIVGWSTVKMSDTKDSGGAYSFPSGETYSRKITRNVAGDITLYPIWAKIIEASDNAITLTTSGNTVYSGCYYISNSAAAHGIVVDGGSPYLFIDGVSLDISSGSPFVLTNGANVNLTVMSDCYFKGQDNVSSGNSRIGYAGINVKAGTTLTISKDSLGKLTAEGGNAWSRGSTGAGIGANGASNNNNDDGCGNIVINGGVIGAYGGYGYVDLRNGNANYNIVAAPGIGGMTSSGSGSIRIYGGTVVASTGHILGVARDGYKNIDSYTSYGVTYRKPIYDGSNNSARIYISNNTIVTQVSGSSVIINYDEYDTLYFAIVKDGNDTVSVGTALSVTIDGTNTIDLGGSTVSVGSIFRIPQGIVQDGSSITLVTKIGNYYTGSATWDSNNNRYSVSISQSNSEAHGTVNVYANDASITGGEAFGSISPDQSFTIRSDISGAQDMTYPFSLTLNTGYRLAGVRYSTDGVNWSDHDPDTPDNVLVSVTTSGSNITCIIKLRLSSSGTGQANYVSFTIEKITVKVTINNTYSEGDISYKSDIVETTYSSGLNWADNTNAVGTIYVDYKDSLTCTIDVTRTNENPLIVRWITVNDIPLTPVYDQEHNKGIYTFTVTDISEETVIEIRYGPTVKLSGYVTFKGDYGSKYQINVLGIDADGNDGFLMDGGTKVDDNDPTKTYDTWDVYVSKGSPAYFKVFSSGTGADSWISHGENSNKKDLGITSITVSSVGSRPRSINPNIENVYSLGTLYADTEVNVTLTEIKWDLIFISVEEGAQTQTQYKISVVDKTYYVIPTVEDFVTMNNLYVKTGYDLVSWSIEKYDSNLSDANWIGHDSCDPGTNLQITCKMVLTTVWATAPHQYNITYSNYDGGTFDMEANSGLTTKYTVESASFNLTKYGENSAITYPVRPGYTFVGWLTDEQMELISRGDLDISAASMNVEVTSGTHEDLHYTAVWQGIPVDFTLRDTKGLRTDVTMRFIVGTSFSNLPIYSNTIDNNAAIKYTFAGWAFNDDMTGRITDTDKVPYHSDTSLNIIYVIWVSESLYIINITNDGSYGGTVTAEVYESSDVPEDIDDYEPSGISTVYGSPGNPIALVINAYSGYKATSITINGSLITDPPFDYVSSPYYYFYPFTSAPGVHYYSITVKFEKLSGEMIPYPVYYNYTYDGTEHTGVEEGTGYHLTGDNAATNAGTYTVTAVLEEGYIWEDYTDSDYLIPWTISPRTAFIIAVSELKKYSQIGEGWAPGSNGYVTLFVLNDDLSGLAITSYVGTYESQVSTITAKGSYENNIHYSPSDNYNMTVIHGTYMVYDDGYTSTVSYVLYDSSAAASGTATSPEGNVAVTYSNALNAISVASNTQNADRRVKD